MKGGRAILVVDGNPLVRAAANRMIQNEHPHVEVVEADRFEAALQLVNTCRPRLVITDIHLKDGDGLKLTEVIANRFSNIIIVIFSNADGPEYEEEALKRGASYFVSKTDPNGGTLMDIVRKCLPRNRKL